MSVHYEDDTIALHHGHALAVASVLPSSSVQTIITSPPYFGLRDYGEEDQIGAESTVAAYVGALVELFRELGRVLADDGTLWVNLGDSYSTRWGSQRTRGRSGFAPENERTRSLLPDGIPEKNLIGVPWRVAFALQDDGWILRSDVIWAKPNPMPESVTDRPTKSHEYLFLLAKNPRYYFDAEAISEPVASDGRVHSFARTTKEGIVPGQSSPQHRLGRSGPKSDITRRAKRDVWTVPTVPFPGSHFAVYPPELIRPCVLSTSRPGDTVLDPFSGSGTTGLVATQEGRKYVGIDINAEYLDLSLRTRFHAPSLNLYPTPGATA